MNKVSLKDIAQALNLSSSTVSRALMGKGNISEETIEAVRKMADKMGYRRSIKAAPPKRAYEKRIVALGPWPGYSFYMDLIAGIHECAAQHGFLSITVILPNNPEERLATFKYVREGGFDGVIAIDQTSSLGDALGVLARSIPIVLAAEYDEKLGIPFVATDDYNAAVSVAAYLASTGRERFAYMGGLESYAFSNRRRQGFVDGLAAKGIEIRPSWLLQVPVTETETAYHTAVSLLSAKDRPDAIFCVTDSVAISVLRAANRLGISVPGDLAIMGFDNQEFSANCTPQLSTMHQQKREIGAHACQMLIQLISGQKLAYRSLLLDANLLVRGST